VTHLLITAEESSPGRRCTSRTAPKVLSAILMPHGLDGLWLQFQTISIGQDLSPVYLGQISEIRTSLQLRCKMGLVVSALLAFGFIGSDRLDAVTREPQAVTLENPGQPGGATPR